MKIIKIILLIVFFLLYLAVTIIVHENIHKFDYRNIPKESENLCLFYCDGYAGYYELKVNETYLPDAYKIKSYTEYHAYIGSFIVLLFFFFLAIFIEKKHLNTLNILNIGGTKTKDSNQ